MSHSSVEVKEVTIEEILKVHAQIPEFSIDDQYDHQYFTERCHDIKHLIIIGYVDQQPAGYVFSYDRFDSKDIFYCSMAGVIPNFRGKSVMKNMMTYLEDWARQHNYKAIKVKTRNNRRAMLGYLIKYDYNFLRVFPYPEVGESRIMLQKQL